MSGTWTTSSPSLIDATVPIGPWEKRRYLLYREVKIGLSTQVADFPTAIFLESVGN